MSMKAGWMMGLWVACMPILGVAQDDDFVPEMLTVEKSIPPGPNAFALHQGWSAPSQVNVLGAADLSYKGNLSMGLLAQMVVSRDTKTIYTTSIYAKRINYGPIEAVLQEFDVDTLTPRREIILSPKMAQTAPSMSVLALSHDEVFLFVQNATPATSVTVVSLKNGSVVTEIPSPGCWGIYPATNAYRYSMLCGDGTITTWTLSQDGMATGSKKSQKIFDVDTSPLYAHAQRVGKDWVFSSFFGEMYRVSDRDVTARLVEKFNYTQSTPGEWAPGGFAPLAYNAAHNVMYVAMHPDAAEGSHKDPATEVWGINMKTHQRVVRASINSATAIAVTAGKSPVLFAINDEDSELVRYESNPDLSLRKAGEAHQLGDFVVHVVAGDK